MLLAGWTTATFMMASDQSGIAAERAALAAQQSKVNSSAASIDRYRQSVGEVTHDLEARQDFLDEHLKTLMGNAQDAGALIGADSKTNAAPSTNARKISAAMPQARPLLRIEQRQRQFAVQLTAIAKSRAGAAEKAIRSLGIDPRAFGAQRSNGQGGPYIPWRGDKGEITPELRNLSAAVARLDVLESTLAAMPSGKPTSAPMVTSSYGYRRDPFNGAPAFHAGLDFPGTYGQPILAAAAGRVSYVGQRQGYGNVVEVDHGHGIMTRYAHLSGFVARVGQTVERGQQLARMGSTGRSTGTHLHFEVRLNDTPINPRRFLEADAHVLQVQQDASRRTAAGPAPRVRHGR